ncbi:hypothetical protein BUALT_Bualt18G0014000 [Buddleja alternifolia]|uniref:Uncharacterized protein n=1 Tax=Buddleja alternifolia TaxID=168488 RepID=A0AAV6W400_9LAMI|nr:hypothetical protein BUALT_Bualt18G0014000 [Buddleja alternifolia]
MPSLDPYQKLIRFFDINAFKALTQSITGTSASSMPISGQQFSCGHDNISPPLPSRFTNVVSSPYLYKGRFTGSIALNRLSNTIPSYSSQTLGSQSDHEETHSFMVVMTKLKALKPIFKQMRKNKGNLTLNVVKARNFLEIVQQLLVDYPEHATLQLLEKFCRCIFSRAVQEERSYLAQRAKMEWLKDGYQCSAFFFKHIASRRAQSHIFFLENVNGDDISNQAQIQAELIRFYTSLLGVSSRRPNHAMPEFHRFIRK